MSAAVMGAGAVGCYYGAMLARAGHAVTLIGRPQHVEAIRRDGLHLESDQFDGHVPANASTSADAVAGAELVLFCVKSTDTDAAAAAIAPHLGERSIVLSLQNGVDNAERLQAALRCEVIPAVVYVATEMSGPGRVKHLGRGELVIGRSPASERVAVQLRAAGVPVTVSDNVAGDLWTKLVVNCAYNALSAITRLPYGRMVQGEGIPGVMHDVVRECLAVAQAGGVTVPGDLARTVPEIARTMPGQYSSTAQDLMRGKPTEIDHLNGYVVRKGAQLGVSTPVNRALHSLVKLLEAPKD
ncbi:MAG: 2-dehydropantoate 2-reductase [Burkholderiaceae bacterium]|nr:2-dehydropantoate 2-reductase [Burkholderiaceae bacterium]